MARGYTGGIGGGAVLGRGVGGDPDGVVLVEPLADATVHANVEAGVLGLARLGDTPSWGVAGRGCAGGVGGMG
jgi:hypothetical protein